MLKALSQILAKEERFSVVGSATNGCQALRHASALAPDLVLIGLHLSKLNGAQATSHIKQAINPPIVFIVSPDDNPTSRAMIEAAGADAFVTASADLEVRLKSRLHERFSPETARFPKRLQTGSLINQQRPGVPSNNNTARPLRALRWR